MRLPWKCNSQRALSNTGHEKANRSPWENTHARRGSVDRAKELRLETSDALLAAGIAASTTLKTLEVKWESRQDWPADLGLALAGRSGGIRSLSPSRWPLRAGASATRL